MNLVLKAKIEELQTKFALLRDTDRTFAASLCNQFWRKDGELSPKQTEWVGKLLDRANTPVPPPTAAQPAQRIGDLGGILALFARAQGHLKYPAIVLLHDPVVVSTDKMLRITVAGEQARYPGTLNVTSFEKVYGDKRAFYGRVKLDGSYEPYDTVSADLTTQIATALRLLAADPARTAAEHGRLTGRCCFCNIALEDERSTAVGYGPICARHFGLAWGSRPAEFAATPVARPTRRAVAQIDDNPNPTTKGRAR
jgi:hypothetical protein